MSYKYQVEKVSSGHYVLTKMAKMRTEVHAFLSEDLYAASEEAMWDQIVNGASYEGVIGAYLMPDCHLGYGVPVGSVIVTDNTLIQAGSGYDISCGVVQIKVKGISAKDVQSIESRKKWVDEVEKRISTGVGSKRPDLMSKFSDAKSQEILKYGAKALGIKEDLCERQFINIPDNLDLKKISKAYDKVVPQLGSVGSGNHFVEMQVDTEGAVWVMIHCGSRGYGWQIANHFFYEGASLRGLSTKRREDSWLYIDEPTGKDYWAYHNSAANFAVANRHII